MKILIIRTLKSELIPHIIKKLEKNFENPVLNLLTHDNQESLNFFKDKFRKIFVHQKNKDFAIKNISLELLLKLKKESFDLVILPRMVNTDLGFLDAIGLSFIIFPKKVAILPYRDNLIYIGNKFLVKFVVTKFFGFFLNITLQLIFWPIFFIHTLINKFKS
tara:strand:+ start:105 stop:590 length:486 start_codon:yes stop_codon:yes gene_type:complete